MPIALDTFRNIGADATRVKLDEAGGVIATATSPGGRAVAWLSEAFGSGKDENRAAINELVASIRSELGNAAGDAAELALQSRLREGRPLSARTVQRVIGNAESLVQGIREQRAAKLSNLDPGPGGIAHAMVRERMADGRIRREAGEALLMDTVQRAAAEAEIRRAVLQAEADAGPGVAPVHADLIATGQAIDTAAARTDARLRAEADARLRAEALFAPGPQGEPSEAMGVARQTLEGLGLPADRVLDTLTPAQLDGAKKALAGSILDAGDRFTDDVKTVYINTALRRALVDVVAVQLSATDDPAADDAAKALVAKLRLDLDDQQPGGRLLGSLANRFFVNLSGPDSARSLLGEAILDAAAHLADAAPEQHEALYHAAANLGLDEVAFHAALPPDRQVALLRLGATLAIGEMRRQIAAGGNGEEARSDAVHKLADLANHRLEAIKAQHGVGEAAALDRLAQEDPEFVATMDEVLASGGQNPAPGGWIEDRKALAGLRDRLREAAALAVPDGSGRPPVVSGNDLQRLMSAGVRDMGARMFERAALTLGDPRPAFTVVALGSTARGEASPFSDIEFGILLPDQHTPSDRDYAKRLSALVREQVIALGETASKNRGTGFHWDIVNNPLSTTATFIGTAAEMVGDNLSTGITDGFGQTMFSNTEWMFGSDAMPGPDGRRPEPDESWQRLQAMHRAVQDHVNGTGPGQGATRGAVLGQWMCRQAAAMAREGMAGLDQNEVDVKALARLPMMLAQGLALEHGIVLNDQGIATNSTHLRLDELVRRGVMSRADADMVLDLQDQLSAIRVRAHLHANKADDTVRIDPAGDNPGPLLHAPELAGLVTPLQDLIGRLERHAADPAKRF